MVFYIIIYIFIIQEKNADFVELVKAVYRFRWNRNK